MDVLANEGTRDFSRVKMALLFNVVEDKGNGIQCIKNIFSRIGFLCKLVFGSTMIKPMVWNGTAVQIGFIKFYVHSPHMFG